MSYRIYTLASLAGLDWAVIAAFGLLMVAIGIYCGRQQADLKEYFNASGNMGSFIVGISLYATLLSTVSYLATPGEIIKHGPAILSMLLGLPVAYVLVGYWIIPSIMRYRVTSAYEILEMPCAPLVNSIRPLTTARTHSRNSSTAPTAGMDCQMTWRLSERGMCLALQSIFGPLVQRGDRVLQLLRSGQKRLVQLGREVDGSTRGVVVGAGFSGKADVDRKRHR